MLFPGSNLFFEKEMEHIMSGGKWIDVLFHDNLFCIPVNFSESHPCILLLTFPSGKDLLSSRSQYQSQGVCNSLFRQTE